MTLDLAPLGFSVAYLVRQPGPRPATTGPPELEVEHVTTHAALSESEVAGKEGLEFVLAGRRSPRHAMATLGDPNRRISSAG